MGGSGLYRGFITAAKARPELLAAQAAVFILAVALLPLPALSCGSGDAELFVASTTSTRDSGLFSELIPEFEKAYPGYKVKVNAVGTGEALKLGERCDVDVVFVHAPEAEEKFVADGYGTQRRKVMYNDFIIVGPEADTAGIAGTSDAVAAFQKIASTGSTFISRGDESGTNKAELRLWGKTATGNPSGSWYRSVGQGMGETLRIAADTGAYTLSDRGTWLSMKGSLPGLAVVVEGDRVLLNQYGVIPVNPGHCPQVNARGAEDFAAWLTSPVGQKAIGDFGVDKNGQSLFVPNA